MKKLVKIAWKEILSSLDFLKSVWFSIDLLGMDKDSIKYLAVHSLIIWSKILLA
jgi:hypothetical protein